MVMKKEPVEVGEKEDREDPRFRITRGDQVFHLRHIGLELLDLLFVDVQARILRASLHCCGKTIGWQVEAGRTSDEEGDNQQTQTQRGIGVVLMQQNKPIAFISKGLRDKNLAKSAYEREMMALVLAIQHWQPYLLGTRFIVCSSPMWLQGSQHIAKAQMDPLLQQIHKNCQLSPSKHQGFTVKQGVLFYKDRLATIGIRAKGALDMYEVAAERRSKKAAARRIDRRSKKAAGVCFVSSRPQTGAEVDHNFFCDQAEKERKRKGRGSKNKNEFRCYECGEFGHFAYECTKWKEEVAHLAQFGDEGIRHYCEGQAMVCSNVAPTGLWVKVKCTLHGSKEINQSWNENKPVAFLPISEKSPGPPFIVVDDLRGRWRVRTGVGITRQMAGVRPDVRPSRHVF
ncbi:hypothetical protein E3N88_30099 [Mikania micrantha]|uniref:CCHC-type domain-containing protein n=1 Tax=Mikania micrantha TaxID=192012 RepID=A0A5N6MLB8_9ASTR|nr:hypothetical protein E3N88_30099 [Mikania micrantha]